LEANCPLGTVGALNDDYGVFRNILVHGMIRITVRTGHLIHDQRFSNSFLVAAQCP
jgi:hypothetical protein